MSTSFLIFQNQKGFHYLHGRYHGNTVEEALDSLATEIVVKDNEVPRRCRDRNDWFAKAGINIGNFRFEQVKD